MYDPDFDPLDDLHQLMVAVAAQHQQIELLIDAMNNHTNAIQNINRALKVARHQMVLMENRINEIDQATTGDRPRRQ